MANYPKTGSTLTGEGGTNVTSTALSTNILIKVGTIAVGAIQSISVTEQRSITPISELGTDGIIDSAPQSATKISGNCKRIRFDKKRIAQAFGRDFIHAHSQRKPFDIQIIDTWLGSGQGAQVITTIKNVWINNINYTYSSNDYIISEDMGWQAETIYSLLSGTDKSLAESQSSNFDKMEVGSDKGTYRGSMTTIGDATALVDLFV